MSNQVIPYGHVVQEYYVKRIREVQRRRREELFALSTRAEAEAYVERSRKAVLESFGPLPERTPLNADVTGTLERDGYKVEKVMYESRPGYKVTANLYVPLNGTGPFPCVVGACGHSGDGKAADPYQRFCQGLARNGYLTLIYDPVSQGERLQYLDEEGDLTPKGCCHEHNMMGNQMQLVGDNMSVWRAWDGIRGLDYLLARPEADATRVGVTGNSGGGTLTSFLNALDERFTMAAPSCFVTTYVRNIENEEAQDSEQIPPRFFELGRDMADFFIARAPRPVILLGQIDDFFDTRGTEETYAEVKHVYSLLGAADDVQLFFGPRGHGYHAENREAMVAFFNQKAGVAGDPKEVESDVEKQEDLFCVPSGQVNNHGSKKTYAFTAEKAAAMKEKREKLVGDDLVNSVRSSLKIPNVISLPHCRALRPALEENDVIRNRHALETEDGMQVILQRFMKGAMFRMPKDQDIELHVPHLSARDEAPKEFGVDEDGDQPRLFIEPRGIGETRAVACKMQPDFFAFYGSDYMHACVGNMLGEPILGRKTLDVLAACALLKDQGCSIHLSGRGLGSLPAAFAALLDDGVASVTLINAPISYLDITQSPVYKWPFSHFIHGVLNHWDLPDVYDALEAKGLKLIDPWNAKMEPVD